MNRAAFTLIGFCAVASLAVAHDSLQADDMQWVVLSKDNKGFALKPSKCTFNPWTFNDDYEIEGRLIEDDWDMEWDKVETHTQRRES